MKTILTIILATLLTAMAMPAFADNHSTLRVVVVQTDDVDAYVAALKKGKALITAQNPNFTITAFQATFAGENTGAVVVAVRHPGGMSDFGKAWEANMANEEIADWLAGLDDLRTITSDSLYTELPLD